MVGNAVATVVIARWENELDRDALQRHLHGAMDALENSASRF
jgi:Na+/H+-dicarboxylate symporter